MPPKGQARRSARKPNTAPDSASSVRGPTPPKEDEHAKPRRGAKARTDSYQLDESKSSARGAKQAPLSPPEDAKEEEDDEGGVTHCICDPEEAETKDMGFMVQCETCNQWQHGICMRIDREEDCPEEYFCHECRPDHHPDLVAELSRRSTKSHAKKSKSAHSSQSSRSISPDSRKGSANSKAAVKRRNTMNSRDPELEIVLDMSRKEAERAGIIPETAHGDDSDSGPGRRKRKRTGELEPIDTSRKRRSVGSPVSSRSEAGGNDIIPSQRSKGTKSHSHSNQSPAVQETTHIEGAPMGRGRRARKDKEMSLDLDGGKNKHPNQYTYRVGSGSGNNSGPPPKLSPQKFKGINGNGNHNHEGVPHATRKNVPQSSRIGGGQGHHANSPSPVPISYNIPDHFSHLAPLLPNPTPLGVSVVVRVEPMPGEDRTKMRTVMQTEKGVKVRWPPKRTTIGEMRRRVRAMMEYVARAQLDTGERERRVELLKAALAENGQAAMAQNKRVHEQAMHEEFDDPPPFEHKVEAIAEEDSRDPDVSKGVLKLPIMEFGPGDGMPDSLKPGVMLSDTPAALTPDNTLVLEPSVPVPSISSSFSKNADSVAPSSRSMLALAADTSISPSILIASVPSPSPLPSSRPARRTVRSPSPLPPQPQSISRLPSTTQLLDELTRELIQFQERFGAGKEAKIYRDRTETRERRARGNGIGPGTVDVEI